MKKSISKKARGKLGTVLLLEYPNRFFPPRDSRYREIRDTDDSAGRITPRVKFEAAIDLSPSSELIESACLGAEFASVGP